MQCLKTKSSLYILDGDLFNFHVNLCVNMQKKDILPTYARKLLKINYLFLKVFFFFSLFALYYIPDFVDIYILVASLLFMYRSFIWQVRKKIHIL